MSDQRSVVPPPRHTHTQEMLAFCTSGMDELAEIGAFLRAMHPILDDTPDHAEFLAAAARAAALRFESLSAAVLSRLHATARNAIEAAVEFGASAPEVV